MTLIEVLMKFQRTAQTYFDYRQCAEDLNALAEQENNTTYNELAKRFVEEANNAPLWRKDNE